jgi:hypothetical protein
MRYWSAGRLRLRRSTYTPRFVRALIKGLVDSLKKRGLLRAPREEAQSRRSHWQEQEDLRVQDFALRVGVDVSEDVAQWILEGHMAEKDLDDMEREGLVQIFPGESVVPPEVPEPKLDDGEGLAADIEEDIHDDIPRGPGGLMRPIPTDTPSNGAP